MKPITRQSDGKTFNTLKEVKAELTKQLTDCGATIVERWFESQCNVCDFDSYTTYFTPAEETRAVMSLRLLVPYSVEEYIEDDPEYAWELAGLSTEVLLYAGIDRTAFVGSAELIEVLASMGATMRSWLDKALELIRQPYIDVISSEDY